MAITGLLAGGLAAQAGAAHEVGNGITVGIAKQFPHRYLELMVEDLDEQLAQLRVVRGEPLAAALGTFQGSQLRSVERGLDVRSLPLPELGERVREPDEAGELVTTKETTKRSEVAPSPPPLGEAAPTSPVSSYGFAAQDLLTEQLNLQYQVFNLRALLNRSVSDRFYDDGSGSPGTRLQVLLGFQISLDPQRRHRGKAAVVVVDVEHADGAKERPSLVALMPQEKTYNAAALSRKSNAFGAAAVTSIVTVGYSERRRGETFYLYHDADTFAFESPLEKERPKRLTFGWQFRPVLGRPAVEPGLRQLFAVLALDAKDAQRESLALKVTARTYWLRYDGKRRVTKGRPVDPRPAYERPFLVRSSSALQEGLTPEVVRVDVVPWGGETMLVKIQGEDFFPDTSVALGERTLGPGSSSFVVRSSTRLHFLATKKELMGSVSLTGGRYGFPTTVEDAAAEGATGAKVRCLFVEGQRRGGVRQLTIELQHTSDPAELPDLLGRRVLVQIGDQVFDLRTDSWHPAESECDAPDSLQRTQVRAARLEVPYELLQTDQPVSTLIPFLGEKYRSDYTFHPPLGATRVVALEESGAAGMVTWGIVGHGFTAGILPEIRVYAGRELHQGSGLGRESDHLLRLTAPRTQLVGVKEVTVFLPGRVEPVVLRAPGVASPKAKPAVSVQPSVPKGSSQTVTFEGQGLSRIDRVEYAGKVLAHKVESDSKLIVFLTRGVTAEKGPVSLVGFSGEEAVLALDLRVE